MLVPNSIPDKEPMLRVGIILPEDSFTSLQLITSAKTDYQLEFSGRIFPLSHSQNILFRIQRDSLVFKLDEIEHRAPNEIKIYPIKDVESPEPKQGVLIKNVISGRDFHWKKYIDVTLPGRIIIRRYENVILLINELPIEHYLMCVATSEMGAACPPALIEAQTIAARSWMLANVEQKHVSLSMDVCNDDCCQRYQGTTHLTPQSVKGAMNSYGQVLLYQEKICDARYSKSCGGVMEVFETIWGGNSLAYMQNKADAASDPVEWKKPLSDEANFTDWVNSIPPTFCSPLVIPENELKQYLGSVDEAGAYFRWQEILEQKEATANINRYQRIRAQAILNLTVLSRGPSGRIIQLAVDYRDENGREARHIINGDFAVRQSLHKKFLFSSAFIIKKEDDAQQIPQHFILHGAGWGHGAGLCQIGALGMSLNGYSAEQIVAHYYPGSELKKIY
jgi:peptidoglycan hydrolase-like amidase